MNLKIVDYYLYDNDKFTGKALRHEYHDDYNNFIDYFVKSLLLIYPELKEQCVLLPSFNKFDYNEMAVFADSLIENKNQEISKYGEILSDYLFNLSNGT